MDLPFSDVNHPTGDEGILVDHVFEVVFNNGKHFQFEIRRLEKIVDADWFGLPGTRQPAEEAGHGSVEAGGCRWCKVGTQLTGGNER